MNKVVFIASESVDIPPGLYGFDGIVSEWNAWRIAANGCKVINNDCQITINKTNIEIKCKTHSVKIIPTGFILTNNITASELLEKIKQLILFSDDDTLDVYIHGRGDLARGLRKLYVDSESYTSSDDTTSRFKMVKKCISDLNKGDV